MTYFPGKIIRSDALVTSVNGASGIFSLADAMQRRKAGQWPVSPWTLDEYVTSLLHFDGADASTTITDSALSSAPSWTATNGAQLDTAQTKFGASSLLLDGTNDYISGNGTAAFTLGTGAFCIDLWVRFNSVTGVQSLYDGRPGANGPYASIFKDTTTHFLVYLVNGAFPITGTTALTAGTWHHIAVTRLGTSTRLFLNGTQEGSTWTDSTDYGALGAGYPNIGRQYNNTTFVNGWIDEFRISKGVPRWTANFTPPTAPY